MKLQDYADLIGCTYRTAQQHFKDGLIPKAFKVGRVIYVPDNILELLEEKYNESNDGL